MKYQRLLALLVVSSSVIVVGCGEYKPQLAKVHGKVTYKDKPVTAGSVLFVPAEASKSGREFPASGTINSEDGSYELKTFEPGDGAAVGTHKVVVIAIEGGAPVEAPTGYDSKRVVPGQQVGPTPGRVKSQVPLKYGMPETTPLTLTVAPGDNTLDIKLED